MRFQVLEVAEQRRPKLRHLGERLALHHPLLELPQGRRDLVRPGGELGDSVGDELPLLAGLGDFSLDGLDLDEVVDAHPEPNGGPDGHELSPLPVVGEVDVVCVGAVMGHGRRELLGEVAGEGVDVVLPRVLQAFVGAGGRVDVRDGSDGGVGLPGDGPPGQLERRLPLRRPRALVVRLRHPAQGHQRVVGVVGGQGGLQEGAVDDEVRVALVDSDAAEVLESHAGVHLRHLALVRVGAVLRPVGERCSAACRRWRRWRPPPASPASLEGLLLGKERG